MSSIDDMMSRIQQIMSRMQAIERLGRRPPAAGGARSVPVSPDSTQAAAGGTAGSEASASAAGPTAPAGGAAFQQLLSQALAAGTNLEGGSGGDLSLLPSNLGSLSGLGSALGLSGTPSEGEASSAGGSASDSALRLQEYQKLLIKAIQELAAEQKRGPQAPSAPQTPQVK